MSSDQSDPTRSSAGDPDATGLPDQPEVRGPIGGDAGRREGPISERLGRDPGNLGDEPTSLGDITTPSPDPSDAQM